MINFYQRIDPSLLIEFQRHLSRNKKLKKYNTECGSHCLIDIAILKLPWIMPSSAKSLSIKSTPKIVKISLFFQQFREHKIVLGLHEPTKSHSGKRQTPDSSFSSMLVNCENLAFLSTIADS